MAKFHGIAEGGIFFDILTTADVPTDTSTAFGMLTQAMAMIRGASTFDQDVVITMNGDDWLFVPANSGFAEDISIHNLGKWKDRTVGVRHLGVAPTTGRLGVTIYYRDSLL